VPAGRTIRHVSADRVRALGKAPPRSHPDGSANLPAAGSHGDNHWRAGTSRCRWIADSRDCPRCRSVSGAAADRAISSQRECRASEADHRRHSRNGSCIAGASTGCLHHGSLAGGVWPILIWRTPVIKPARTARPSGGAIPDCFRRPASNSADGMHELPLKIRHPARPRAAKSPGARRPLRFHRAKDGGLPIRRPSEASISFYRCDYAGALLLASSFSAS
jgi:hypothetical protein